jgi:LmbE family N-acetylglucosaminyl deacetylase
VLVVSPHLDDAVFACGDFIASRPRTRVVTVFAGGPAPGDAALRPWDADCGFTEADDVIRARRAEDQAALTLLGASPIWLSFRDDQYGGDADAATIADALTALIDALAPPTVVIPLGIFHRDHRLAREAALRARARRRAARWLAYEDVIYRRFPGDPVGACLQALRASGASVARFDRDARPASSLKRAAIASYRSQLRGLETAGRAGYADALAAEGLWELR